MKYSLLILLACAVAGFGQPVEGPYVVTDNPYWADPLSLALRNDSTADIFYGELFAYRQPFSFATDDIEGDAQLLSFENSPHNVRILPVDAASANGWWYVLGYGDDGTNNLTMLAYGDANPENTQFAFIDDGDNVLEQPFGETSVSRSRAICPRVGGGCIISWMDDWMYDNGWWQEGGSDFRAIVMDPSEPEQTYERNLGFSWFESAQALSLTRDTLRMVGTVYDGLCVQDITEEWTIGCFDENPYSSCSLFVVEYLRTFTGREFALGIESNFWQFAYAPRLVELDSVTQTCQEVMDIVHNPIAWASHPLWGMAWLSKPGAGLLLTRVDTAGSVFSQDGTLYWPEANYRVLNADLAISPTGWLVASWWEINEDVWDESRIMIARVFWDTPLFTNPEPERTAVGRYELQTYPNPFNSELQIEYDLPRAGDVELGVFNVLGQQVAELSHGVMPAGRHQAMWSAHEGSGIYFVTLRTGETTKTQKVLLAR